MRTRDRAAYICQIWYEQGVRAGRYLSDVPFDDLSPEHRAELLAEAIEHARKALLVPQRRRDGKRQKVNWVETVRRK